MLPRRNFRAGRRIGRADDGAARGELAMPIDRARLCWTYDRCKAVDARAWLGACSNEDIEKQLSPSGWPMCHCRVRVVGVVPQTDTTRAEM